MSATDDYLRVLLGVAASLTDHPRILIFNEVVNNADSASIQIMSCEGNVLATGHGRDLHGASKACFSNIVSLLKSRHRLAGEALETCQEFLGKED